HGGGGPAILRVGACDAPAGGFFLCARCDARASRPSLPSLLRTQSTPLPYCARRRYVCGRPWRYWASSGDFKAFVLCVPPSATMHCAALLFSTVYGDDYAIPGICTTARQADTAMRRTTTAVRSR
ncbi:hypothetical protein AURDEDRAFT_114979, partial [Auricularia subglabra TFB-10046 SS5]